MPPKNEQREREQQHGWCVQLRGAQAFAYYLAEVAQLAKVAQRNVCARDAANRDFEAGRLSAFLESSMVIDRKYNELKPFVEVTK